MTGATRRALDDLSDRQDIQQMLRETRRCLNCGGWIQRGHGFKVKRGYCSATCYYTKPPKMAWLERIYRKPIREVVLEALNSGAPVDTVAELLGISKHTLYQWINKLGIERVVEWR